MCFKTIGKQIKYEYGKCVFSIVLLMLCYKKCVFKANEKLLFSLLSYFYNIKYVCSKQMGAFSLFSYFCNMEKTRGESTF